MNFKPNRFGLASTRRRLSVQRRGSCRTMRSRNCRPKFRN